MKDRTHEYRRVKERKANDPNFRERLSGWNKAAQRRANEKLRRSVLAAYGGKCSCCGEEEYRFLTLDHIKEGSGKTHRAGRNAASVYRELRDKEWPKGYRVLCWNCNCGRTANGGVCPHKMRRSVA